MNGSYEKIDGYCVIIMLACFMLTSFAVSVKDATSVWWVAFMTTSHLVCFLSAASSVHRDRIA